MAALFYGVFAIRALYGGSAIDILYSASAIEMNCELGVEPNQLPDIYRYALNRRRFSLFRWNGGQACKIATWPGSTCNLARLTPVPGRDIQRYRPGGGYVLLDGEKITHSMELVACEVYH